MARRRAKGKVAKSRPAVFDIVEIADALAQTGGDALARRFVVEVEETAARLAGFPRLGTLLNDEAPELRGVRYCTLSRFRRYVIFYREVEGGVQLLRILHGARDLARIFPVAEGADSEREEADPHD